ncbi:unnamed protein product [Didymodactylos carnosus]|uniref:Uncharacterized protein n=1 Tax=Didymodactylos carnosus TaxID=1234261 RepID=A0A815J315_9BILA|nr:unnamed protein product [Didymodactylos carnosus]CAF4262451.1 unnamed protein product [Didymodactylos carnosus]
MILIHKNDKETSFILTSGFEAQNLIELIHKKRHSKVWLMHLDDVNGSTIISEDATDLSQEEMIKVITVIRLFNGVSRYNEEEIDVIKKCLAVVDCGYFDKDAARSKRIYDELESKHHILNGFMTYKLAAK